ncbi:MAG TPA: Na+/H+ antiporter NhaC family protein [Thermoanaerobaculia bacterium]|nr:Na+/H+ antiporter NhaC family protein [Thermoanaerobaculia bacterium]
MHPKPSSTAPPPLRFSFGLGGALAPFALFISGVAALALAGAPDERGFWPVLLAAMTLGLALAKDRTAYAEALIAGMSQPIVMIMIMAWLLAGLLGLLMTKSGFIDSLIWCAGAVGVEGSAWVVAAFLVCCVLSTSTGTSLGTILLCGPLLYPPGGALGADPIVLMGAIVGGATFGDNISPISDTTIASALTQEADIGGVVRSRLRYALAAAAIAIVLYVALGRGERVGDSGAALAGSPAALPMLLAPTLVVFLLLRRRHLLEGLIAGIVCAIALALALGRIAPGELVTLEAESFGARGILLEGLERGVGASIFTLLLMGLVGGLEATGVLDRIVDAARRRTKTPRGAELWIVSVLLAVMLLITHTTVAILTVGKLARDTGRRFGIGAYRRANLLDATGVTLPFILPYMIPVILAASTTADGEAFGLPRLSPAQAGIANFHSWAMLGVILFAVATGWGRGALEEPREGRSAP